MSFDYEPPRKDAPTVFPRFHVKAIQNNYKTEREGRPIFDEVEYVEITVAGDTRTVIDERVKDEHRQRWPESYKRFREGQEQAQDGTPLEAWPALSTGQVAEYKALNIRTVEALAALDDGFLSRLGTGGRVIRDKAKAWLERAQGDAPLSKALADIEDIKAELAVKDKAIADQAAEIERLKNKLVESVA